jgi:hypothetical protein
MINEFPQNSTNQMKGKFLYGASVQGIQSFIFQTNKLREIIGASELVEQICTSFFSNQFNNTSTFNPENLIVGAAGNIKYIFDDYESCQKIVKKFPRNVMEMAPGICISQAVVALDSHSNPFDLLEKRLRIQRNRPISITNGIGLMLTETARKTGGVGVEYLSNEVVDKGQLVKDNASKKANFNLLSKLEISSKFTINDFPFDLSDIVKDQKKNWLAVIHADGNSLGKLIMDLVSNQLDFQNNQAIKDFSNILNLTTLKAASLAFEEVIAPSVEKGSKIPFRPVIIGGDDLTAIVRADLALSFTKIFLQHFEKLSIVNFQGFDHKHNLKSNPFLQGLSACAGIAYIKSSFPLHYGIKLADSLCKYAKGVSKQTSASIFPSSIMFHKVHASYIEEFDDIIEKELMAKDDIYFNYGPYFLHDQPDFATITQLEKWVIEINKPDAPKSGLRNWLTELKDNPENASQALDRIIQINHRYIDRLSLKNPFSIRAKNNSSQKFTPIFDIISISNIIN